MNVLITGITGFVGSHLADFLLENEPKVKIYGLKRWRSPLDNISHCLDKINLIDADLRDLVSLNSVFKVKFDRVFHLAAQSYVPSSYVAPIDTLDTNVIGTANLLEAIRLSGQNPLIHICSSSEVYGQPEYAPMDEKHPLNPISPYAVSKVAGDRLGLMYYKTYGMNIVITRMFNHTGPRRGSVFSTSSFAKQIAEIEKGKRGFVSVGNLASIRTFCDVRDAVRAYWLLNKQMLGQVYNIGGSETLTIGEMLDMLIGMAAIPISIQQDKSRFRPNDVTLQIPDCRKFIEATGWQPTIPLKQTLADLLQFWRAKV